MFSCSTASRSSGWMWPSQLPTGSASHSAGVAPRISSTRELMYVRSWVAFLRRTRSTRSPGSCSTSARYRVSVSRASASLSRWRVTSYMIPCQKTGRSSSSRTRTASSRNQTVRPSRASIRYSALNGSPSVLHALALVLHPLEVVGDEPVGARGGVGQPLLGREAQDGFDLWAHVEQRAGRAAARPRSPPGRRWRAAVPRPCGTAPRRSAAPPRPASAS